jgi:hypothetical protein
MNAQGEFSFDGEGSDDGHTKWLAIRRIAVGHLARQMNLPLGHQVEIWLYGGIRLRGKLRLQEAQLFVEEDRVRHVELLVDNVAFTFRDIESCVRLD